MSLIAAPYGLRPVKRADGVAYSGAVTQYLIDPAGLASNLFTGQVVAINAAGFLSLVTATGADATVNAFPTGTTLTGAIGVFMGCEFVNAQGQLINSPFYPSGTVAPAGTQIKAFVVDDPRALFQAQLNGAGGQTIIGSNTFFAAAQSSATGSTRTGNSTSPLSAAVQTASAAFRIVGHVSPTSDPFPDVLVMLNPGYHAFTNAVGL